MRNERIALAQGDFNGLEESALIDLPDVANKNAAAAASCVGTQKAITDKKIRTVAQDQPAVAGLHNSLDYDCRPKCSGGRAVRKGSTAHTRRLNYTNSKK